jgi:site-specific DNA-methyltransferase (adenine-specific)
MNREEKKRRAPRNRTLLLGPSEEKAYLSRCFRLPQETMTSRNLGLEEIENRTFLADLYELAPLLPEAFVDLLFVDPPYNLDKRFSSRSFSRRGEDDYEAYVASWLDLLLPLLKAEASVYICADWQSSSAVCRVLKDRLTVRSRITWEREKGRGAKKNWKNSCEDIWFATRGSGYYFDIAAVKEKRRVLAPYRDGEGRPKGWMREDDGDYRLTHPSNLWTDLTVPYWSMPENTDHPAQKPEKLLAKIILASSPPGAMVMDPFLGSGTCSVTAKKLGRRYLGIEREEEYAALAEKRLALAEENREIQGFRGGVFFRRNSH